MFRNYVKIAWRNLIKRKVFTTINILGLAIGFGSSILIYLFLNYNLSFDKFHANADNIYRINTEERQGGDVQYDASVPPGFAKVFSEEYSYADKVAKLFVMDGMLIDAATSNHTNKYKKDVAFVEADFFKIFNFPLVNGGNQIDVSAANTAVITEIEAIKMFGSKDVIGKTFVLENDKTIQITGVLRDLPKTTFLKTQIFVAFQNLEDHFSFGASESWGGIVDNLQTFTLLKPSQNLRNIESALLELPKKHRPDSRNKHTYKLQALADIHLNKDYGGLNPSFLIIFGLIGLFLIVIACINFINISTAQAFYRSKEIGIRKVLGSYKQHLFWQFLTETFLISLFAIGLGIILAILFLPAFNRLFELELSVESLLNVQFVGFLALLLGLVSFLSGSYPGILMSRIVPVLALKGKMNHNDTGGSTTRKVLVVAQFTISIALIVATLVISKQIEYATNTNLGFDKESIVMMEIPDEIDTNKFNSLKERLKKVVGVQNVTGCFGSPGASDSNWGTSIKYNNRPEDEEFGISVKVADVDYIKTFSIPLATGRNFFQSDSINEMLVNEKLAEKLGLAPEDLIGKTLKVNGGNIEANIVGVVENFHDGSFTDEIKPIFIAPNVPMYNEIAVKINHLNIKNTLEKLNVEWSKTFSNYIFDYRFLDERVAAQYETEVRYLSLSKVFSALAIFIGCLGLYGLILFFVNLRTKEIGIRKVLGSTVSDILNLFSIDFLKLIVVAGLIATPITWHFMNQWLEGYRYRVEIQWWYFALAIFSIMLITIITISYQTLKVAIANPIKSLRTE